MKVVFDTNVYFDILADPDFLPTYGDWLRRLAPHTYVSSVVVQELLQGAKGELARRRVRRATASLERVGRVVTPTHEDWARAGAVQGMIWDATPSLRTKNVTADILIASSAARIGAIVVTANVRDFELVARHVRSRAMTFSDAVRHARV